VIALAKGSPESIGEILGPAEDRPGLFRRNQELASKGRRVLACAWRELGSEPSEEELERGFRLAGLVALADPVRASAPLAVARARAAGIRCIVVTGDQLATAVAVARECGLDDGRAVLAPREDLAALSDDEVRSLSVGARATSEDKLALIRALRRAGDVVIMAGDGVNDAAALRAANVGVALPGRGPPLPAALSDVVLTTSSLETIVAAVAEGRALRDNVRQAARYVVATNAGELFFAAAATILGIDEPLTPLQLLWINLIGDTVPALALALEPQREDVLRRPPPRPRARLIEPEAGPGLAAEAAALAGGAGLAWALSGSRGLEESRTSAVVAILIGQLAHALRGRARRARPSLGLGLALVGSASVVASAHFFPPLRRLAGLTRPTLRGLASATLGGLVPTFVLPLARAGPPNGANP
jgi:Ca2+-transporting ATPase